MLRWLARLSRPLLLLVGALPFLPLLLTSLLGPNAIAAVIEGWFSFQCHRDAARSLGALGHELPVCARCLGIYLGLGLGALVVRPRLGAVALKLVVGLAALVMLLDVLTELLGMRPESALLRLASGLFLAWPVAAQLVLSARAELERPALR